MPLTDRMAAESNIQF